MNNHEILPNLYYHLYTDDIKLDTPITNSTQLHNYLNELQIILPNEIKLSKFKIHHIINIQKYDITSNFSSLM